MADDRLDWIHWLSERLTANVSLEIILQALSTLQLLVWLKDPKTGSHSITPHTVMATL